MSTASARAYETHAREFLAARDASAVGALAVQNWARTLAPGADVLEIGCGGGLPVTRALVNAGLTVWAVDASPTLVAEFKARFPHLPAECSCALQSTFFGRCFDAIVAIGVIFLLEPAAQTRLIERIAARLRPAGCMLFSAPIEIGERTDRITAHRCESLGHTRYASVLAAADMRINGTFTDEGHNHHYVAVKTGPSRHA